MTIYFQTISHMHVNVTALFIQALVTADCSRYDIFAFSDYRNINVFSVMHGMVFHSSVCEIVFEVTCT